MTRSHRSVILVLALLSAVGCARRASVLMERSAKGPVAAERELAQQFTLELAPTSQTIEHDGVELTVSFASHDYLKTYFQNRQLFGRDAGMNPYFSDNLVLYMRVANHSTQKIKIDPNDCVLLDDLNNQYQYLQLETITTLAASRAPIATFTRSTLQEARPGYFGVSVPAGAPLAGFVGNSQQRYALLKQVNINPGLLYPGVVYDGFVAFWTPHRSATTLRAVWPIKMELNANDEPQKVIDFDLPFTVQRNQTVLPAAAKAPEKQ